MCKPLFDGSRDRVVRAVETEGLFAPPGCNSLWGERQRGDLNPIEQFFAKTKHGLREAAKRSFGAVIICRAAL